MNNFKVGDVCIWNYENDYSCPNLKKGMEVIITGIEGIGLLFTYKGAISKRFRCLPIHILLAEEENE